MESNVKPVLAELLRLHRKRCNAEYVLARVRFPSLENSDVLSAIPVFLEPLLEAASAYRPESLPRVFEQLYALLLETVGRNLLHPANPRSPVGSVWTDLLPLLSESLSREPVSTAAALSNSAHYAETALSKGNLWVEKMTHVVDPTMDLKTVKQIGVICAWTLGLARCRPAARKAFDLLDDQIQRRVLEVVFNLSRDTDPSDGRLFEPWEGSNHADGIRFVGLAGNFFGLDGEFERPPTVLGSENGIVVTDQTRTWTLFTDRFGLDLQTGSDSSAVVANRSVSISPGGVISWLDHTFAQSVLGRYTSFAVYRSSLAVTLPDSFRVYVFANPSAE